MKSVDLGLVSPEIYGYCRSRKLGGPGWPFLSITGLLIFLPFPVDAASDRDVEASDLSMQLPSLPRYMYLPMGQLRHDHPV